MSKKHPWRDMPESLAAGEIAEVNSEITEEKARQTAVVCALCDETTPTGTTYYSAVITPEDASLLKADVAQLVPMNRLLDGRFEMMICWPCAAEIRPEDIGVLLAKRA
jgi:hypothetical protein